MRTADSVYGRSGAILYRDNATTGVATDYIRAAGKTISRLKGSVTVFPHQDHLGSPVAETGLSGAVNWREAYSAYGEKRLDPVGNRDDEGFTGHIDDAATGLTYMQARYYDPVIGRFLSNDPVAFAPTRPQMFNRYSYALNNPVNMVDPDGRVAILAACLNPACGAAVASAATAVAKGAAFVGSAALVAAGLKAGVDHLANEASDGDSSSGIRDGATPGRETKGRTKQFDKPGGVKEANEDFDAEVDPDTVVDRGDGVRTGETPDGRKINVRPTSSDGRPTVEIQDGKNREKFRFGDPHQEEIEDS